MHILFLSIKRKNDCMKLEIRLLDSILLLYMVKMCYKTVNPKLFISFTVMGINVNPEFCIALSVIGICMNPELSSVFPLLS
jgi:hypothetical protein